jgi:hypothetical protein
MTETTASHTKAAREFGAGAVPKRLSTPPAGILIGYARSSTEKQGLSAQREILCDLGVGEERVYLTHGLTGTNRFGRGATALWPRCGRVKPGGAQARPDASGDGAVRAWDAASTDAPGAW